jgi:hypothetical protein
MLQFQITILILVPLPATAHQRRPARVVRSISQGAEVLSLLAL